MLSEHVRGSREAPRRAQACEERGLTPHSFTSRKMGDGHHLQSQTPAGSLAAWGTALLRPGLKAPRRARRQGRVGGGREQGVRPHVLQPAAQGHTHHPRLGVQPAVPSPGHRKQWSHNNENSHTEGRTEGPASALIRGRPRKSCQKSKGTSSTTQRPGQSTLYAAGKSNSHFLHQDRKTENQKLDPRQLLLCGLTIFRLFLLV